MKFQREITIRYERINKRSNKDVAHVENIYFVKMILRLSVAFYNNCVQLLFINDALLIKTNNTHIYIYIYKIHEENKSSFCILQSNDNEKTIQDEKEKTNKH